MVLALHMLLALTVASLQNRRADALNDLRTYTERFTGRNAKDCGEHFIADLTQNVSRQQLLPSLDCAIKAAVDRTTFRTLFQTAGIDSLLFEGLLAGPDGIVYRFSFDSAPCGGDDCWGRFAIARCDLPALTTAARPGFVCGMREGGRR
jgi:hypothetical protein